MRPHSYLHSAQALRTIAIFAVVVIHAAPFARVQVETVFTREAFLFLNTLARFAIPFFFVLSGYLFGRAVARHGPGEAARRVLTRVVPIYFVWSAVFAVLPRIKHFKKFGYTEAIRLKTVGSFEAAPWDFLFSGPGTHLWYLVALALSVVIAFLFMRFGALRLLLVVTGLCYAAGLLGGLYHATPLGIDLFMNAKLGPFGGPFLFALGLWQSGRTIEKGGGCGLLIVVGMLSILAEMTTMRLRFGAPQSDFYLGSVLVAVGLLRFVVSRPNWAQDTALERWGAFSLGVYVAHPMFLRIPRLMEIQFDSALWQLGHPVLIFAATLAFCVMVGRVPSLRRFVT